MNVAELRELYLHRADGESINATMERVGKNCKTEKTFEYHGDFTIPRYKLLQPTTQIEGASEGFFMNMVTGEEFQRLYDIVFLKSQNTRAFFDDGDFSGTKRCWSRNGYIPEVDDIIAKTGKAPISEVCATKDKDGKIVFVCPLSQWRNQSNEPDPNGTKPPICKASISCLGIENGLPFWMVFHGSSLPVVKDLFRYIRYKCEQAKCQGEELHLRDFRLTIATQLQTTTRGKFYTVKFEKKEIITDLEEKKYYQTAYCYFPT